MIEELGFTVLIALGAFVCFKQGSLYLRKKTEIENLPAFSPNRTKVGKVRLSAVVETRRPLVTPFVGIPCAFFSYSIKEWVSSGRSGSFQTRSQGESDNLLYLRCSGTVVLADSNSTDLDLKPVW